MTKPHVELTLGKFRFVNGTAHKYKAQVAVVPSGTNPDNTNTKWFGGANVLIGSAEVSDVAEPGGVPAGYDVHIWFQEQRDPPQWMHAVHANNNDAVSGAFVIDQGGGSSLTGEIILGIAEGTPMISSMTWTPITAVPG